jgi:hypothetical protein
MAKGPRGERRPADVIGAAIMVARIATGEIKDNPKEPSAGADLGRKGGMARAKKLSREKRREIAENAAKKRWGK